MSFSYFFDICPNIPFVWYVQQLLLKGKKKKTCYKNSTEHISLEQWEASLLYVWAFMDSHG